MSEHTPLTEAERDLADLLHPWLDSSNHCPYSPQSMCPNTARSRNLARLVAARTSTATADTGLRERVEALRDEWAGVLGEVLAVFPAAHITDKDVSTFNRCLDQLRAILDATAAPTTDTGARDE